jgi:hypothetical protein
MIISISKYYGKFYVGQRGIERNTTIGRTGEALSAISNAIHGTSFLGFIVVLFHLRCSNPHHINAY